MPDFDAELTENLRGLRRTAVAAQLTAEELAAHLEDHVWPLTLWRSWPDVVLAEAIDRLRRPRAS